MITVSWFIGFEHLSKNVTNPHPHVDPNGIKEYGIALKDRLQFMSEVAEKMQGKGWSMKIMHNSIKMRHSYIAKKEVEKCILDAGIPYSELKDITIVES